VGPGCTCAHTRYLLNEPTGPYRVKHISPEVPGVQSEHAGHRAASSHGKTPPSWGERPASKARPSAGFPCIAHHSLETYALRMRGDSMTASSGFLESYPVGSIIFVDTQPEDARVDGERVVARIDETGEVTCKVFKHEDGKRWLLPLNPTHEPIREAFTVLGTVVGK
jgi:hypothetical protein